MKTAAIVSLFRPVLLLPTLLLLPLAAHAGVANSAPNGFVLKFSMQIYASPEQVYAKLVHNVGDWWDPFHTYSNDSHNLSIEEKPMGCFCEKLPGGGGVRHLEVAYISPNKRMILLGGLGPLQNMAVTGSLVIDFVPDDTSTRVDVMYSVAGYFPTGTGKWPETVDRVLDEQFTRLKNYVEKGKP